MNAVSKGAVGILIIGYAVTPLHPGAGRAPGVVDLPVQRDPIGYPMLYSSGLKGALKAECARRANVSCFKDDGRIDCDKEECRLCCCLFGGEPGEASEASGLLSVLDMVPLLLPVPSSSHGYLYITTPYLARKALMMLEVLSVKNQEREESEQLVKGLKNFLEKASSIDVKEGEAYGCVDEGKTYYIVLDEVSVKKLDSDACEGIEKLAKKVGGLAQDLKKRLLIVPTSVGQYYVEKGLIRVTRVRLRVDTKTAVTGGLWTEEYIPQGTIFLTGLIATLPRKNKYCSDKVIVDVDEVRSMIEGFKHRMQVSGNAFYMIVGGKETIGRGLIKFMIV